jgi:hypothetical protein
MTSVTSTPTGTAAPPATTASVAAPVEDDDEGPNILGELSDIDENPSRLGELFMKYVPPRRYPYVLGVAFAAFGFVSGYIAHGQAQVAQGADESAHQAQIAVAEAQAAASLANVLYGLAIAAVLVALVLEFLPEPAAEKASLTLHF